MKLSISLSLAFYALSSITSGFKFDDLEYPAHAYAPIPEFSADRHRNEYYIGSSDLNKYPNITLGYGVHLPTLQNKDAGYLLYKNIRYGQNPINDLRWALPKAPENTKGNGHNLPVFNGSDGYSCHQANPQWATDSVKKKNPDYDWEDFFKTESDGDDCLFLDVATPIGINVTAPQKFPVLVWIYGGGFVYGKKDMPTYSPAGFYRRATKTNQFVYVAINYRMGAHGFLSGPRFEEEGGISNLGIYDQKLGLKWIHDNIAKFGGDPAKVTVMGESAGAGSIVHQLVWSSDDANTNATNFQKAILQSPAWVPIAGGNQGNEYQDSLYEKFLNILEAEDLDDAKSRSEEEIVYASRELVRIAPHGTFNAGPVVDGKVIKAHPLTLMSQGKHNKAVEIFTGDVGGEGLPFVPLKTIPTSLGEIIGWRDWSNKELRRYITTALPLLDDDQAQQILELYPAGDPAYWGRQYVGITVQTQRLANLVGEALVQCNARGISTAYSGNTYNYYFDRVDNTVPNDKVKLPVLHGGDVYYTFYDKPTRDPKFNTEIAENWQKYIMGFVLQSNPNLLAPRTPMPKYGPEAKIIQFDFTNVTIEKIDPYSGARCDDFWPLVWSEYGQDEKKPPEEGKPPYEGPPDSLPHKPEPKPNPEPEPEPEPEPQPQPQPQPPSEEPDLPGPGGRADLLSKAQQSVLDLVQDELR